MKHKDTHTHFLFQRNIDCKEYKNSNDSSKRYQYGKSTHVYIEVVFGALEVSKVPHREAKEESSRKEEQSPPAQVPSPSKLISPPPLHYRETDNELWRKEFRE